MKTKFFREAETGLDVLPLNESESRTHVKRLSKRLTISMAKGIKLPCSSQKVRSFGRT